MVLIVNVKLEVSSYWRKVIYDVVIQKLYYNTTAVCFRRDRGFLSFFFVFQEGCPCLLSN